MCTRENTRIDNPMYFTKEAEGEVITESVSQKLDRTLINPSKKVWRN